MKYKNFKWQEILVNNKRRRKKNIKILMLYLIRDIFNRWNGYAFYNLRKEELKF